MTQQQQRPAQRQHRQPGIESDMTPRPQAQDSNYRASGKLADKVAFITGGDSGIGRAVAILFAKEGADIAINYLNEQSDALETLREIEKEDQRCLLIPGDIGDPHFCEHAIERTVKELGHLDVLVNNAAEQHPAESIEEIPPGQIERTFRTNVFSMFYLTRAALKHLRPGSAIINTTSVTAYKGSPTLLDYSATKGAIVAFTRSLLQALVEKGIRVNVVAPGPVWTPLIASTFPAEKVAAFGSDKPMGRAGEPMEIAPCYLFLAANDSSYMSGQVLHPNCGEVING